MATGLTHPAGPPGADWRFEDDVREVTVEIPGSCNQGVEAVTLWCTKTEEKVVHADTFRQRNMSYALVLFGGVVTVAATKVDATFPRSALFGVLAALMFAFTCWDRRWHRIKHGWDETGRRLYGLLCYASRNPGRSYTFRLYFSQGENRAEWLSFQPVVFYVLTVTSALAAIGFLILEMFG